jgi:hypothetical protein
MIGALRSACIRVVWHQVGTKMVRVLDHEQTTEIFLRVKGSDCSSELIGLYDVVARLMSLALQYGASAQEGRRSPHWSQICPVLPHRRGTITR